ncbi:MAG: hypothetical protein ACSLFF_00215 [Solirubrobacterales bacterium]
MIRTSLKYARQNAVAFLALFVALSGTAYAAAKLPSNSVGTKQIKKSAVIGAKVKKNTLTGTQINESKLTSVPDAVKLGGLPASAFLAASGTAANAEKLDGVDSAVFGTALTIAGSAFVASDDPTTKLYQTSGAIMTGNGGDFHYAVNLPQGARVTSLDFRFIDSDIGSNSSLSLIAFNSIGATSSDSKTLVSVATSGYTGVRRNGSATPAATEIIDNTKWSYVLVWSPGDFGPDTQLVGGRINYTVPTS